MNIRILAIDDDKEILYAISAICNYKGWTSETATSVKEGILKFQSRKPDIVLIDYHLPVINGIEGVRRLRLLDSKIPIIVLTIEEDQVVADKFNKVGASDFALKPIKAPDIISRINVHLKMKGSYVATSYPVDDYIKGISLETLEIIENYMVKKDIYYSLNDIASNTELAYQTVHRYLYHMEIKNKVEIIYMYGKIGRPQKRYKLIT